MTAQQWEKDWGDPQLQSYRRDERGEKGRKWKKKERKNSNCHTQSQLKQFKGARNRLKHKSSSSVSKRLLNNLAQCKGARASPFTAFMAQLRPKLKKNIPFKHQREKKIINFQFYYSLSDSLCSPWLDFQLCCFCSMMVWNNFLKLSCFCSFSTHSSPAFSRLTLSPYLRTIRKWQKILFLLPSVFFFS